MLILSRKEGESIVIEGGVRIVVLSSDRKGVRIGIDAPPNVRILRGEIVGEVANENRRASTPAASWIEEAGGAPRSEPRRATTAAPRAAPHGTTDR